MKGMKRMKRMKRIKRMKRMGREERNKVEKEGRDIQWREIKSIMQKEFIHYLSHHKNIF
jgi:hypothetical protein